MGINRPGGFTRYVLPSGVASRGTSGLFTPDLSGGDVNPYPGLNGLADGKLWNDVRLVSNRLHNTAISGGPPYDDGIVLWPGSYGDNVTMTATIYRTGTPLPGPPDTQEVELLICGSIGPYHASFYECQYGVGGNPYANIVRWNGGGGTAIGQFTEFGLQTGTPAAQNGDVLKATKVGSVITVYLNNVSMTSADVSAAGANIYGPATYARGFVGVGFFQRGGTSGNLLEYGLSNITVTAP